MARRGRPRSKIRMEQPRRKRPDKGTGEVQLLRAWYAGNGDPALTSYPLGILLANAVLTDDQHKAVCRYAWLHWAVFGRPSVAAVSWEFADRAMPVERDRESEERKLGEIHKEFQASHRRCRAILDNIAIYERPPRWMLPVNPRPADVTESRYFLESVTVLMTRCSTALAHGA